MQDLPDTYLETTTDGQKARFAIRKGSICRIGRNPESEMLLRDDAASRNHAMLQYTESGELYLIDLGSRNGTFLNGQRITAPVLLRHGDVVGAGDQEFILHQNGAAPAARNAEMAEAMKTKVRLKMQVITVLVADIRGYTGLAQQLGEARISEMIGAFMQEAGEMFQQHGSWAQKYIGDAIMAVWVHRNHIVDEREMVPVLQALAKLQGIVESLQPRFGLEQPVRIGVGINTGLATIGNLGSQALADHTALGDVVNKAFRLESATKEMGCDIVVGQATGNVLAAASGAGRVLSEAKVWLKGYQRREEVFTMQRSAVTQLCRAVQSM